MMMIYNSCVCKAICCQQLIDKTAGSAVHDAILPAVHNVNAIGCKIYGTDIIEYFRLHTNTVTGGNTTAITTSKLLMQELGIIKYNILFGYVCNIKYRK